ncbi:MAG: alpha-glucosidase/alpha-galactosidase [Christensenellales bacterium]|jgi:alpha-galactosidase
MINKNRKKIVFIGAGSFIFTRNLCRDILTFDALQNVELWLVDINQEYLEMARRMVQRYVDAGHYPATVHCTLDRREALEEADGILCTIQVGGWEALKDELGIPSQYGVEAAVGDTRGVWGFFCYLRTIQAIVDIAKDAQELCPNVVFLNYTNPMSMICRTVQTLYPELCFIGLCHSVQETIMLLAKWLNVNTRDMTYTCAGLNHTAFYLTLKYKGQDVYPMLREVTKNPEIYKTERVRIEMFRHLGYFVTESSYHNSEYNGWFRKRDDLMMKYCPPLNFDGTPGVHMSQRVQQGGFFRNRSRVDMLEKWFGEEISLERGHEYASYIFNACFGDGTPFEFNGNVRNFGLIDNLPKGACVEVPIIADENGLKPVHIGFMPQELALLNNIESQTEEMVVEAYLQKDKSLVYKAVYYDPYTAAKLSLDEMDQMVSQMFAACGKYHSFW